MNIGRHRCFQKAIAPASVVPTFRKSRKVGQLLFGVECMGGPAPDTLIRCEQASVTMRLRAGLSRAEFTLLAPSRDTSRSGQLESA